MTTEKQVNELKKEIFNEIISIIENYNYEDCESCKKCPEIKGIKHRIIELRKWWLG